MSHNKLGHTKKAFIVLGIVGATAALGAGSALASDHTGRDVCTASAAPVDDHGTVAPVDDHGTVPPAGGHRG
ncbi:hypothetical protein ACH4PU_18225 [Streptomyces sp. NPDC021100]|uniref:hypothetical protein n=1 Tax=Streptomyces sp. NPDC021100 TaxID=3365114 RepID=UPI003795CEC2